MMKKFLLPLALVCASNVLAANSFTAEVTSSPSDLIFGVLVEGYTVPSAKTVTVSNTTSADLSITMPSSSNFTITALTTNPIPASTSATFTVTPVAGKTTASGTISENLIVVSGGTSVTIPASYSVELKAMAPFKALGLEVDGTLPAGSPVGGKGQKNESTMLNVQKEIFSKYGYSGSVRSHTGWSLKKDIVLDGRELPFSSPIANSRIHPRQIAYTTLEEFDATGTGQENYVAELSYDSLGNTAYLTVFKTLNNSTGLEKKAEITFSDVYNVAIPSGNKSNEVYSALFEIDAGDYDGDGVDEIAISYPNTIDGPKCVYIYEYDESKLQSARLIGSEDIAIGDGAIPKDSDGNPSVVALSSGIFKRNGQEQLFITTSETTDMSEDATHGISTVYVYDYQLGLCQLESSKVLETKYSSVTLANLKNIANKNGGEITAVIGGFKMKNSYNSPSYTFLTYENGEYIWDESTHETGDVYGLHYAVNYKRKYHAPIGMGAASLLGEELNAYSRDFFLIGTGVYELDTAKLAPKPLVELSTRLVSSSSPFSSSASATYTNNWIDEVITGNLVGDPKQTEQFAVAMANSRGGILKWQVSHGVKGKRIRISK